MDSREEYKDNIIKYCRKNFGERLLQPAFNMFWPVDKDKPSPGDLAFLTSKIIYGLSRQGILREVKKPKGLEDSTPYGMYEILDFR